MVPTAEIAARIGASFVVFAALVVWELALPRRSLKLGRTPRWPHNLGLLLVDIALVRLLVPTAAVGVAVIAAQRGFGLFNVLSAPGWLAAVLGFVVLDFAIYLQHAIFHHVPALWRLHRVHHADLELDVSTGVRFHPLEILLSLLIKMTVVAVIGVPAVAVLIFEIVLNATSMFNHANVAIPPGVERWLRLLVVTPDARSAPFGGARRDRQQFRLQSAVVGSSARHLSCRAGRRRSWHDHRAAPVPGQTRTAHRPAADAALPSRR